jgi:xylan 1,4-beta-xylosidase
MLRSRAISKTKLIIWIIRIILIIILPIILFWTFQYFSKAAPTKANIVVDARAIVEPIIPNWKNLAQGGEEKGVRMLEGVISDIAGLYPRYIRLDHIYDYYDVVSRNHNNQLVFDWSRLDQTICDIYHAGARPFLVLGYMPPAISKDGSLISPPNDWSQWRLLVKKTIERYSGKNSRLCGGVTGEWFNHIYYEVWNEPDLETFGQWSLYKEERSYLKLYENTVKAAEEAENVHQFYIGGPVTTALYRNWILKFLDYIITKNLRLDFISWHHYTSEVDEYLDDINKLNSWLMTDKKYEKYRFRQKIISEWGYDSNPNPIADTSVGAAHTVAAIINLLKQKVNLAFSFEIKDGPQPSWGVLSYDGRRKPRYYALKMLNEIGDKQLSLIGEGTYVRGVASYQDNTIKLILVNYDKRNSNTELVPVRFYNLAPGIMIINR